MDPQERIEQLEKENDRLRMELRRAWHRVDRISEMLQEERNRTAVRA